MEVHFYETSHVLATPKLLSLLIYISFFLLIPFATPITFENTTFKFPSFTPNNTNDITCEADANPEYVFQAIQLTANHNFSSGRATYKEPMHLWDEASGNLADFTTHFSFIIDSQNRTSYGDGLTFFLTSSGSNLPPNSDGYSLGLLSNTHSFLPENNSIVAIEFDTFSNEWDPAYVHVGIDVNTVISVSTVRWWTDIISGRRAEAQISYDSRLKNLSVYLTDGENISTLHYVIDLRDYLPEWVTFGFSAATGVMYEAHTISSWDFNSSLQISAKGGRRKRRLWVGLGVAGGCVLVGLVWLAWGIKRHSGENEDGDVSLREEFEEANRDRTEGEVEEQNRYRAQREFQNLTGLRKFSYRELVGATCNFANQMILGKGGSGSVYKAFFGDISAAVKRINTESQRGMKEYESEVKAISQLRHRNLVRLIGWCHENENFLIVYEFMPNKSLDFHLFKKECLLTWEMRYTIALDLASALFYLQENCEQCVLHRDIKSGNVLLDLNFNAKLGDFGLARIVDHGQGSHTTRLMGTWGYMAPEYLDSGEATKESDIYSFGIVVLEITCGRRAIEKVEENGKKLEIKLVEQVWENYGRGNIFRAADPRLCGNYDVEQMKRLVVVGLSCVHAHHNKRPSMQLVLDMLNSKAPLPELPSEMPMPIFVGPQENASAHSVSSSHGASGFEIA